MRCSQILFGSKANIYSSYKNKNELKGIIGVDFNGVITYASKLCPGFISDKKNCKPVWSIKYIS